MLFREVKSLKRNQVQKLIRSMQGHFRTMRLLLTRPPMRFQAIDELLEWASEEAYVKHNPIKALRVINISDRMLARKAEFYGVRRWRKAK